MLPDNEFSGSHNDIASMDTMYHNYLAHYAKVECMKCGLEQWIKNDRLQSVNIIEYVCPRCAKAG